MLIYLLSFIILPPKAIVSPVKLFITIFFKSKLDKHTILIKQLKNTILLLEKDNEKITTENRLLKNQLHQIYNDHPEMFA